MCVVKLKRSSNIFPATFSPKCRPKISVVNLNASLMQWQTVVEVFPDKADKQDGNVHKL